MIRVNVSVVGRKSYSISISRESVRDGKPYWITVPIEHGYQSAAIDLVEKSTGLAAEDIEWNVAPEPQYSKTTLSLFTGLESRLAEEYSADEWADEDAVEESMNEIDDLLRRLPDQVTGCADVRVLFLESIDSMMDYFEISQFDGEILWSHGRLRNCLPTDLSTMPTDWNHRHILNFAFMAYPFNYIGIDELIAECTGWDEIRAIADLYAYIHKLFDARIDSLDESVKEYVMRASVGPTNYSSSKGEYGFYVYIPYVVICYLHEREELRQFITGQTPFDQLWATLGATGKLLPVEVHDFLSGWQSRWTGEPIDQRQVPAEYYDDYADLPAIVHDFWREVGFAGFDHGLLWVCDPHQWQPIVDEWLAGLDLPDGYASGQIPLFRTGLGEIICFKVGLGNVVRIDPITPEVTHMNHGKDFAHLTSSLRFEVAGTDWVRPYRKIADELGPLDHTTIYSFEPLPFAGDEPAGPHAIYRPQTARRVDARSAMAEIHAVGSPHLRMVKGYFWKFSGR